MNLLILEVKAITALKTKEKIESMLETFGGTSYSLIHFSGTDELPPSFTMQSRSTDKLFRFKLDGGMAIITETENMTGVEAYLLLDNIVSNCLAFNEMPGLEG